MIPYDIYIIIIFIRMKLKQTVKHSPFMRSSKLRKDKQKTAVPASYATNKCF